RAAGAALADYAADNRRLQPGHLDDVPRQRLRLAPLFGAEAGVGAGRVDERDDRRGELRRHLHQTQGLPVALWVGHAEVALEILLGVPALLVADHHDRDAG